MLKAKAIVLLGFSGLLIVGALFVAINNMGNRWPLHLFMWTVNPRAGMLMVYAGVAACVLWAIWRVCVPAGMKALRGSREATKAKATQARLDKLETPEAGPDRTPEAGPDQGTEADPDQPS